jgi:integrase
MKEIGRSLRLDGEAERKLLAFARQPLRDVIILMRDTGMRNRKELFRMRIENLDWNTRTIFVPDSKTPTGRRYIPMSDRVLDLLMVRCGERHTQELQAEINWEVVETMDRVESDDTARFGKARTAREKELRDPDGVFIEAEERRRELARQAKKREAEHKNGKTAQSRTGHKLRKTKHR